MDSPGLTQARASGSPGSAPWKGSPRPTPVRAPLAKGSRDPGRRSPGAVERRVREAGLSGVRFQQADLLNLPFASAGRVCCNQGRVVSPPPHPGIGPRPSGLCQPDLHPASGLARGKQ